MKAYLLDTFHFNDITNRKVLGNIALLPDRQECIKLISHLINSQNKWQARILGDPGSKDISIWEPVYAFEVLESEWNKSIRWWIGYIVSLQEEDVHKEIQYAGFDGRLWKATVLDIVLQINYHIIHHRAQIQTLIRKQGVRPDFVDYILTRQVLVNN